METLEEEKRNRLGRNICPGEDSASEAVSQEEAGFSVENVNPEDRELLEHILYFMTHNR